MFFGEKGWSVYPKMNRTLMFVSIIMVLNIVSGIYVPRDDYYQATSKDTKDTSQNDESEAEVKTHPHLPRVDPRTTDQRILEMQKLYYKYQAMSVWEKIFGFHYDEVYPLDRPGLGVPTFVG